MISSLAYQVSYVTEYQTSQSESHDRDTRFFSTRESAVAYAQYLTNDATENNGVFVSEWAKPYANFASFVDLTDVEEIRVIATVSTVTIEEIEASL